MDGTDETLFFWVVACHTSPARAEVWVVVCSVKHVGHATALWHCAKKSSHDLLCLSCCWFGYETKRPADILLLRMAFNGFRQAKCFSLYAVPLGTGAKLLISYERSKKKAQRRCRISFFSSGIAAVFNLMKQQKIELLAGTLGKPEDDAPSTNNSITAVNLL